MPDRLGPGGHPPIAVVGKLGRQAAAVDDLGGQQRVGGVPVGELGVRTRAADRAITRDRVDPRLDAPRIAVEIVGRRLALRGVDPFLHVRAGGEGRARVGELLPAHRVGARVAGVPLPGLDHVAGAVVLEGLLHPGGDVVRADQLDPRDVAGPPAVLGRVVGELPGRRVRPVDLRQLVAAPDVGPGARGGPGARHRHLRDRVQLAARGVGVGLAAAVGEVDGGQLAAGVVRLRGVARVLGVDRLVPEPAGKEVVLAAVEVVELPAAASRCRSRACGIRRSGRWSGRGAGPSRRPES